MLRTTSPTASLWEAILPAEALGLPTELATVDRLLDDPAFIEPFRAHFDPRGGRPSIPIDTYLRLMFLKFRYRLGYELPCREVADSISWQRFCRIPLGSRLPHPTTLVKLTQRVGEHTVAELNQALLYRAAEGKLVRTHKLRADTTVVAANVAYPTDLGLLARAVDKLAVTTKRAQAGGGCQAHSGPGPSAGGASPRPPGRPGPAVAYRPGQTGRVRGHRAGRLPGPGAAGRRPPGPGRRPPGRGWRPPVPGSWPDPARRSAPGGGPGAADHHRADRRLLDQAHIRLGGGMPDGASRLVSLPDPDARPIRKGRLGRPVEFGYKAQVIDNPDGIVLDHQVMMGNPPDAPLLVPAIGRVIARTGKVPGAVTADRGYGEAHLDQELADLGVARVAIPRRGRAGPARQAVERRRGFRRLVKWRTGCEGRISCLKHRFGWDRTRMDGLQGARIWCGHGVLAHNLVKISGLLQATPSQAA